MTTTFISDGKTILYTDDRNEWRRWLEENFDSESEIWFAFPTKASG
jgi:hypothetical protein